MSDANGITATQVPLFERFDNADVRALIEAYPLAWVCGGSATPADASLLPLIGVFDDAGRLVELIGHLMRANPLYAALEDDPRATILFTGPQAYISPEHARRRDWAPTWNYAQVTVGAQVEFGSALTELSLKVLIDAMEAGRPDPWSVEELGPRYRAMLDRIIGFRARVTSLSGKFKLGQDEDSQTLDAILDALPDGDMTAWMRRFNPER
ncbi:FMN-binding negative transcriptional regulator [Sphingomonas suaedae]|uniref:FMN-binding negative transcriptional regulator n=1 Tax=Sphingomonas suaedae TaxID=2599297 RepID=A0A518RJ82_9SPHN|nr:FMN-binding negative transcriptional regulator [Sphingomonas suaedae]QDX27518.1 FMN-binding negative transcriptional regulator [Sphingomonas suaedae]